MTTQQAVVVKARRGVRITQYGPLRISFDDRVLEPRPWTAVQGRWARQLTEVVPEGPVLELCAGAGQIGMLAVHDTDRQLVSVDSSPAACAFIRANARSAGMIDRIDVRNSRIVDAFRPDERFPLIIADPPWVPRAQTGQFPNDPLDAINGGSDGLAVARQCLAVIADRLELEGAALLQLGSVDQIAALSRELPAGLVMNEYRAERGCGAVVKVVAIDPGTQRRG
jgi:methylase of polypeptide subunit release factors